MARIETNRPNVAPAPPERGPVATTALAIAGVAFLALFAAWIPLYLWLQSQLGEENEMLLGLVSGAFWLLVLGIVVGAVRWSETAFRSWTTADLMLAAVLGAVFGLLFYVWALVYDPVSRWLGDWSALMNGFWYIPVILLPYIIRKPGAALIGETLAAVIAFMIGSPWGFLGSAIAGLTQGIGAEVIYALTGWRRYDWLTLTLAGLGATITGFVFVWPLWNIGLSTLLLTINFVANAISVFVFAVLGGKLLGDALLTTGALNRFAIARERRQSEATDF